MRQTLRALLLAFLGSWAFAETHPNATRRVTTATVDRFDGTTLTAGPFSMRVTDATRIESVDGSLTRQDLAPGQLVTATVRCAPGDGCRLEKLRLITDIRLLPDP